jgi:hypothetical protein
MIWKKFRIWSAAVLLIVLCTPFLARAQQAPKTLSIVRNDSTAQVTFEYRSNDGWKKVTVDAQKDISVAGDRVRIGTDRPDKASVTVELPIEGGKKYMVFWNDPPGMWDFKGAL